MSYRHSFAILRTIYFGEFEDAGHWTPSTGLGLGRWNSGFLCVDTEFYNDDAGLLFTVECQTAAGDGNRKSFRYWDSLIVDVAGRMQG